MPGIVSIVSAISDAVVSALDVAGYAPLTDGKILYGRQHQNEHSAPPRIIFIPTGSTFGPKSVFSASNVALNQPYSPEAIQQMLHRSIATEFVRFEVRCWAVASPDPDPDLDLEATQALYQCVIQQTHALCAGNYKLEPGSIVDSKDGSTQHVHFGREFVFGLAIGTPVLGGLLPQGPGGTADGFAQAPANTAGNVVDTLWSSDGTKSGTCT